MATRNRPVRPRPPSTGGPRRGERTRDRRRDQVRRQQQRAHHEPVAHVRARDLRPGERREREPRRAGATIDRPAGIRTRRRARSCVHARNPANGSAIAMSEVDISIAEATARRRSRPAATSDSLRRNQNRPSPASSGLNTISARIAAPRRQRREQEHRRHVQPAALRIGGEPVAEHLVRVPQRDVTGRELPAQEREPRQPERQDVGVIVRQERVEREPAEREQHAGDDRAPGPRTRRRRVAAAGCRSDAERSRGGGVGRRDGAAHGASAYGNLPVFAGFLW